MITWILAILLGIIYRFSEVEYVWGKSYLAGQTGWRWKGDKVQYYRLRGWCKGWVVGLVPAQVKGTWQWYFHRLTFSVFEDGYHFFNALLIVVVFCVVRLWSGDTIELIIIVFWRFIGTQAGRMMIIQDIKGVDRGRHVL